MDSKDGTKISFFNVKKKKGELFVLKGALK